MTHLVKILLLCLVANAMAQILTVPKVGAPRQDLLSQKGDTLLVASDSLFVVPNVNYQIYRRAMVGCAELAKAYDSLSALNGSMLTECRSQNANLMEQYRTMANLSANYAAGEQRKIDSLAYWQRQTVAAVDSARAAIKNAPRTNWWAYGFVFAVGMLVGSFLN